MMGTVFEIVIRYAKESVGIGAGQFYTPRDIVRLMTEITLLGQEDKIYQDGKIISVYDPCCGTGGILTLTKDTIEETAKERRVDVTVNLFGQELNDKTYALCKSDIIMKGDEAKGIAVGDTLLVDEFRDQNSTLCWRTLRTVWTGNVNTTPFLPKRKIKTAALLRDCPTKRWSVTIHLAHAP